MIVLLELLTALLEYIDLILQLSFFQQEFTLSYKYLTYYADIMLNAFLGTYYAQNYASIIGGSLLRILSNHRRRKGGGGLGG